MSALAAQAALAASAAAFMLGFRCTLNRLAKTVLRANIFTFDPKLTLVGCLNWLSGKAVRSTTSKIIM